MSPHALAAHPLSTQPRLSLVRARPGSRCGHAPEGLWTLTRCSAAGGETDEVLERTRELARPLHRPLVLPYVGLTVVARALGAAKGALLAAIPSRWVRTRPIP